MNWTKAKALSDMVADLRRSWGKFLLIILTALLLNFAASAQQSQLRIIASSDNGGTDPGDFQSMVHMFAYTDNFYIKNIISSPHGENRAMHIPEVIDELKRFIQHL